MKEDLEKEVKLMKVMISLFVSAVTNRGMEN
jgi:hypothetical protein